MSTRIARLLTPGTVVAGNGLFKDQRATVTDATVTGSVTWLTLNTPNGPESGFVWSEERFTLAPNKSE